MSMRRSALWLATLGAVVLPARTFAYALEPSPLARDLSAQAGGPRLWVLSLSAGIAAVLLASILVFLGTLGVSERRRLESGTVLGVPDRPAVGRLLRRWVGLSVASVTGFALLESTLHWEEGLGWHGLGCVTGPVHRDALPILLGLSLVAAAAFAVGDHVVAWLRRTLARLASVRPAPRSPVAGGGRLLALVVAPRTPLGARGPPVASL